MKKGLLCALLTVASSFAYCSQSATACHQYPSQNTNTSIFSTLKQGHVREQSGDY